MKWFAKKKSVKPEPSLDVGQVERLMLLAEDVQVLAAEVRETANLVRQEMRK